MTDDKRNFRSYYYEKFGFLGVEEKKSIEILLSESPLDLDKLSQFCLRFPVPSMHRALVWKVMLGTLCRRRRRLDVRPEAGCSVLIDILDVICCVFAIRRRYTTSS